MHFTLSSLASATLFSSLLQSANARILLPNVANFLARKDHLYEKRQLCTSDIYASVLGDPEYASDIIPFCSSFISILPVTQITTVTPRITLFPTSVSIYGTETVTITGPGAGATVTATAIQTDFVAKIKGREMAPEPTPKPILDLINGRLQRRQSDDLGSSITSALSSACSCLHIPPAIIWATSLAQAVTKTELVIDYEATTEERTVAAATDTVTTTIETTVHTGAASSTSTDTETSDTSSPSSSTDTSSPSSSTDTSSPSSSTDTSSTSTSRTRTRTRTRTRSKSTSTTTYTNSTSSTESSSPSTSTSSTTETTTTDSTSSTTEMTSTTTSSSASSTSTSNPTCPGNGTIVTQDCYNYLIECGIDYPAGDSYNLAFFVPTLTECITFCTDAKDGMVPCLGISFLPDVAIGMANCYIRSSLADPDYAPTYDVVSAILLNPDDVCSRNGSSSTTTTTSMPITTGSSNTTTSSVSGSPTMWMNSTTSTTSKTRTRTRTRSRPSMTPTMSMNSTTSTNSTSPPTITPTSWSNSTTTPSMTPTNSMNSTSTMMNMTTSSCPQCIPITFTAPLETITVYGNTTTVTVTKSRAKKSSPTTTM